MLKARDTYGLIYDRVRNLKKDQQFNDNKQQASNNQQHLSSEANGHNEDANGPSSALVPVPSTNATDNYSHSTPSQSIVPSTQLVPKKAPTIPKPKWHAPWKLCRVISGHLGWVRCVAVEPGNEWFATGAADRVIKIWDLASGKLKLSLTGHVSTVRGLVVSPKHPYLFSCGEDRQVKCWDLEYNKVNIQYPINQQRFAHKTTE